MRIFNNIAYISKKTPYRVRANLSSPLVGLPSQLRFTYGPHHLPYWYLVSLTKPVDYILVEIDTTLL